MSNGRFLTKFNILAVTIGFDGPDEYCLERIKQGWPIGKIFLELRKTAVKNELAMIHIRTLRNRISELKRHHPDYPKAIENNNEAGKSEPGTL